MCVLVNEAILYIVKDSYPKQAKSPARSDYRKSQALSLNHNINPDIFPLTGLEVMHKGRCFDKLPSGHLLEHNTTTFPL